LKEAIEKDLKANIEVSRQSGEVKKIGAYLNTVFSMSKLSENEVWMMKQFACLPSEFHNYELLNELIINEESPYKNIFSETLMGIAKKGWLLQNTITDSYKMHRIVADVVKKQHKISIDDVKTLIDAIAQKLNVDQTKDNPVDKFLWIPFGRAILNNFNSDPSEKIASLQNNLAFVFKYLGDYESSKSLLEKVLQSNEKNFGKDHPSTAVSYSNLATVLKDLGDYEGAKSLLEKAVQSDQKNFGKDHPHTARSYGNLAVVLQKLGDFEGAKSLLEKAVQSNEKNFGKDHPYTATSYSNLALVLRDLGDYEGAKSLLEQAVKSDEKNFGKDHPDTATSYFNLALVLQDLGDYEGAKSQLKKGVQFAEKFFGKDHPNTARIYSDLALVLQDLGDYDKALELSDKALSIFKSVLPEGHSSIQTANKIYQYIKSKSNSS